MMKNVEDILEKLREGGFMSLSLKERKAPVPEEAAIYHKATKKEKGKILDEFEGFQDIQDVMPLMF